MYSSILLGVADANRRPRADALCLPPRGQRRASKDFMARNGIRVHLAVIKRRRCKEPRPRGHPLSDPGAGAFYPEGSGVIGGNGAFTIQGRRARSRRRRVSVTAGDEGAPVRRHRLVSRRCSRLRACARKYIIKRLCSEISRSKKHALGISRSSRHRELKFN